MYTVYAGLYDTEKQAKSDSKKIEKMGLTPYIFSKQNKIALMTGSFFKEQTANALKEKLKCSGINSFVENGI
ncbi:MAG: SPOR domain-containing protein [Clostridia bacterium]|jgi:cell division septation protein DedD|nr:SPOR domain-containing protein [Clostridia bacterium]